MQLKNGDHAVLVSPQGGSILQWQWREHFILGPTRTVRVGDQLKKRGITHWCWPNFGTIKEPKYVNTYPQHGFLWDTVLDIASRSGISAEFKKPLIGPIVKISVDADTVTAFLIHKNDSGERMPVLPALHPYFAVPKAGLSINVNDVLYESRKIPSNAHPADNMRIAIPQEFRKNPAHVDLHGIGRVYLFTTENCSHVVIWSDKSSEYVCVEPIFGGAPGSYGTENGAWLEPGETFKCAVGFHLEPF